MHSSPTERDMARLALGELEPEEAMGMRTLAGNDPEVGRLLRQMHATREALQAWGMLHEALPEPPIPTVRRRQPLPRRFLLYAGMAAAAALVFWGGLHAIYALAQQSDLRTDQSRAQNLAMAMSLYALDHDGKLPPAGSWCSELMEGGYISDRSLFQTARNDRLDAGLAMNAGLGEFKLAEVASPQNTVLFFENALGTWNASGTQTSLRNYPRYGSGFVVVFADGHAELVPPDRLPRLLWKPMKRLPTTHVR